MKNNYSNGLLREIQFLPLGIITNILSFVKYGVDIIGMYGVHGLLFTPQKS